MSKRIYDSLDPIRRVVDRTQFVYRNDKLDEADVCLLRQCLLLQASLLYDLLPSGRDKALNDYHWALASLNPGVIDVYELGSSIKQLGLSLRLYLNEFEEGRRLTRSAFLKQNKCAYRSILLLPLYPLLDEYLSYPTVESYRILVQFVDFMTKLNLKSVSIEDLMILDYDAQERAMETWTYPEAINDLKTIIGEWFADFRVDLNTRCHHGSGASAQLSRLDSCYLSKESMLSLPPYLERLYRRWGGDMRNLNPAGHDADSINLQSELVFVPKSMITNRVISKEPVTLMWLQQGLKDQLYAYFKQQPFIRRVINLENQSLSANMAKRGSVKGDLATIDLSAASDSVSLELVARLFQETDLYLPLVELRSRTTVHKSKDGTCRVWKLRKYAPMGSALCFPVECIVFASICELARRRTGCHKLFRVYGDDLVVPREYVSEVESLLQEFHFTVNVRKSYVNGHSLCFREACGGEYLKGVDVTPVRLSRNLVACSCRPSGTEYSSWVGLINRLTLAGYSACASYARRLIRLMWSDYSVYDCIQHSNDPNIGLFAFNEVSERRSFIYDKDCHTTSYWTTHVVATVKRDDKERINQQLNADLFLYYRWLQLAVIKPRRFDDGLGIPFPDALRPERDPESACYPARNELVVTPVA